MSDIPTGNNPDDVAGACFQIYLDATKLIQPALQDIPLGDLRDRVTLEAKILTYAAIRSAINVSLSRSRGGLAPACDKFDQRVAAVLPLSQSGIDVDHRLQTYFALLCDDFDRAASGEKRSFGPTLSSRFMQFSYGAGGPHDPVVIGNFFDETRVGIAILVLWGFALTQASEYLGEIRK